MGLTDHYRAMARYNRWMNGKLYAVSAELSDEERKRDLGAFFRSVHRTFNHILLADRAWLGRFAGTRALELVTYEDFAELSRERGATDDVIDAWVAALTEAELERPLAYAASDGQRFEHPLWWAVSHFFNHQTHHRGQITTLLKQLGRDPGVTDLAVLLRSQGDES